MEIKNKPLWVIEFDKSSPPEGTVSSCRFFIPSEEKNPEATPLLDDEAEFYAILQKFFSSVIDSSLKDPEVTGEIRLELEDLSKKVENLQEWMKKFKDSLDQPDDLSSQDPS